MRLGDGLALDAVATWFPAHRETVADMVAAGRVTVDEAADFGLTEVPVSDLAAPDMAVRAAQRALLAAAYEPARIGLVAHAWTYHQGHDFWSPPHYIAKSLGARNALPFGVQQMCNAGSMALSTAAGRLIADPDLDVALITTADRFGLPGFDRWRGDYAVVYGDAGTAALLRRRDPGESGGLVLRALAFATAADFEVMYRGRDEFSPAPGWHSKHIDVRRTKKAYLETYDNMDNFKVVATECIRNVVTRAVDDAGIATTDSRIRYVVVPRLSDSVLNLMYVPVLEGWVKGDVLKLRECSGHLGAGDMIANIAYIWDSALLTSGDIAVLIGGGGGFTWSCAVIQAG